MLLFTFSGKLSKAFEFSLNYAAETTFFVKIFWLKISFILPTLHHLTKVSNIPSKAGVKLFSEPPWMWKQFSLFHAVFSLLFLVAYLIHFPSTKIVGDLVRELISVLTGCNCKEKYFITPFFYTALKKNQLIVKTIKLTWTFWVSRVKSLNTSPESLTFR